MIVPASAHDKPSASESCAEAQKTPKTSLIVLSDAAIATTIFLTIAALFLVLQGNRLVLTNDEGILLIPAQQILHGARPYLDFFGYMSPGSYWMQALVFRLAGVSLFTGRMVVILDFAAQCGLLFWLTARLSSRIIAIGVLITFVGLQIADPSFLTAQHRWDSATLSLAALCLALKALEDRIANRRATSYWASSGALLGAAAWCTPSMALVGAAVAAWLLITREHRAKLLPFVGGILGISFLATIGLMATGSLSAFINQMLWLKQNYSEVNTLPYGAIIGGYRNLMDGSSGGLESAVRMFIILGLAMPAILPPLALLLWGILFWRRKVATSETPAVQLLVLATIAQVLSIFPRADVVHLAFVSAISYALVWSGLARLLSVRLRPILMCGSILLALPFASNYFSGWQTSAKIASPVGTLRVPEKMAPDVEGLLRTVHPGDTLYVHPYMPIDYYLTQAVNPTRFAFLAPGMMTSVEEQTALTELQKCPPQWLLYLKLSQNEFLRVFPNAVNLNWRFPRIEDWLEQNYRPLESPKVTLGGYRLWTRVMPQATCPDGPR